MLKEIKQEEIKAKKKRKSQEAERKELQRINSLKLKDEAAYYSALADFEQKKHKTMIPSAKTSERNLPTIFGNIGQEDSNLLIYDEDDL